MTATITRLPHPTRSPDPAHQAALAELLQFGLTVARLAARLAEVETAAVDILAEAAIRTTRATVETSPSLGDAIAAGREADANDAARDAIAARVATITDSFEKAARAVRRTIALQARLADGRPFREPTPDAAEPPRVPAAPRPRPANDAERPDHPDAPEWGDEIAGRSDREVVDAIRHDLAGAASSLPPGPATPESVAPDTSPCPPGTNLPCPADLPPDPLRPAPPPAPDSC